MKKVLITGITGQDGSLLAEQLIEKGYRVIGTVRDLDSSYNSIPHTIRENVKLKQWDMLNQDSVENVVSKYRPDEIYNFAAFSTGTGMFDNAVEMAEVNGLAVTRILEAIRKVDTAIKFCQASSSEMFGDTSESPQNEKSPFYPRSPYGAAKLYAHNIVGIYRRNYGLFACSAILYNHESPRRSIRFVTRKVTQAAAKVRLGLSSGISIGNLDALRDWGYAGDYVNAMWLMLQSKKPDDYILSTGVLHSVRDLCDIAFSRLGLNFVDHVKLDPLAYRAEEHIQLVGLADKAKKILRWEPSIDFYNLITLMVDADFQDLKIKGRK